MTADHVPDVVRQAVARDLRPVKPLAPAWQRAGVLAPAAAIVVAAILWLFGIRNDIQQLGVAGWGFSVAEIATGLTLVGLALHDAIPGQTVSRAVLAAAVSGALALVVTVTLATMAISPRVPPPHLTAPFAWYCFKGATLAGLPGVWLALGLAARALPVRPAIVGLLCGFGGGLFADAGWRLFCDVTAPSHVLIGHVGAIAALTLAGALGSGIVATWRNPFGMFRR